MKRRILKAAAARRDVVELALYIARTGEGAGFRFAAAVESSLPRLLQSPKLGESLPSANALLDGIRVWPVDGFRNHLIFYRELPDGIEVIRVLHGARDWLALFADDRS